jgi:hypothetical protein
MSTLPFDDLEKVYEALALGIDRASPEHEALFLAKLVLLLAHDAGQYERFSQHVDAALQDLPAPASTNA